MESLKELNKICQKPNYKKVGNWMVRNIVRDAALPITWVFLHTPITANQVTFISLVIGITGCCAFAFGNKASMLIGALLLQLWYLLDHVDGQVARYRKQTSLTGLYFDYITHYVIHAGIFLGIGFGAFQKTGEWLYSALGCVAAFGSIFFNLVYDAQYKAFFVKMIKSRCIKVKEPGGSGSGEEPRSGIFRSAFSFIHKLCEVHVLMNIVTSLAILSLFTNLYPWDKIIFVYAFLTMFVAFLKNTYFVLSKAPDKSFKEIFETENEC